jgi:hypothetical protein
MEVSSRATAALRRLDPFLLVIAGATVLARLALTWSGVHLDLRGFGADGSEHYWQLLDPLWLRHDLLSSVWSLTMQPPLYNLGAGLWLHLPHAWQVPVVATFLTVCFLVISLTSYATMVLLGVHRVVALVATLVLVVADPGQALFATVPFYAEPTAALVALSAWLAVRLLQRPTTRRAASFATAAAATALFNTSVQPIVVLLVVGVLVVGLPQARRAIVVGSLIPCLVLVGWSALQLSRVETPATSTWLGMNLTHVTFNHAPAHQLDRLIARGTISKQARTPPFGPLSAYGVRPVHAGPPSSADARRPDGQPNFNNRAYATVSDRYLADELAYVRAEPGRYLTMVSRGLRIWTIPEDQYPLFFRVTAVQAWERAYDHLVLLQGVRNPYFALAGIAGEAASVDQLSFTLIAATAICLLGTPIAIARQWRRRRRLALGLLVPWLVFAQAFVVTSATESGENNRFRFETGTTMLVLSVVVITYLANAVAARWRPSGLEGRLEGLGWADSDEPTAPMSAETTSQGATT